MSPGVVIAISCLAVACVVWMVWEARHPLVLDEDKVQVDDFDRALIRAGLAVGSDVPNERWRSP